MHEGYARMIANKIGLDPKKLERIENSGTSFAKRFLKAKNYAISICKELGIKTDQATIDEAAYIAVRTWIR